MDAIHRLRMMALQAIADYYKDMQTGGHADYPRWAKDALEVCKKAEIGRQFSYLHSLREQAKRLLDQ